MKKTYPLQRLQMAMTLFVVLLATGHYSRVQAQEEPRDTLSQMQLRAGDDPAAGNPTPPAGIFSQNLVTPSPDGIALIRGISMPVDKYTGVANIQIPITEIKIGEGSVPVTLSYQTSGIKVADVASTVGLGWRLSAGGRITRSTRGRADNLENFSNRAEMNNDSKWNGSVFEARQRDHFDLEPDQFYFEYPGGGGMFLFDDSGTPVTIPSQNLKIVYKNGQFTITDTSGTEYMFSTTESTHYSVHVERKESANEETYTSTWFLNHIKYANGALVSFNYMETDDYAFTNFGASTVFEYGGRIDYESNAGKTEISSVTEETINYERVYCKDTGITIIKPKYLASVTFKDYKIEFSYDKQRTDIAGMSRLTAVTVSYAKMNKRTYQLAYGNFANNNLKLLSLSDVSIAGSPQLVCSFDYYEDVNLPIRGSYTKDHWGYWNGNQTYPIHHPTTTIYSKYSSKRFDIEGINRDPSLLYARANTIKQVKYATGGTKEFQFELHKGVQSTTGPETFAGGLRVKKIIEKASSLATPSEYSYTYGGGVVYADTVNYTSYSDERLIHYPAHSRSKISYYISSSSVNETTDANNCSVIYSLVTEHFPNGAYTEYKYVPYGNEPDQPVPQYTTSMSNGLIYLGYETSRMSPKTSYHWKRNLLQSETQYDAAGALVQRTRYQYDLKFTSPPITGISCYSTYIVHEGLSQMNDSRFRSHQYVAKYKWNSEAVLLSKVIVEKGSRNLPSETTLLYDEVSMLPTQITKTDCEGNTTKTVMYYPTDYTIGSLKDNRTKSIEALIARNILAAPIETIEMKNDRIVNATLNLYDLKNGSPLLTEVKKMYLEQPIGLLGFHRSSINGQGQFTADDRYETVYTADEFDYDNTLLSSIDKAGNRTSIIYGYRNTLPIATVQNARHSVSDILSHIDSVRVQNGIGSQSFELPKKQTVDFRMQLNGGSGSEILVSVWKISPTDTLAKIYITPIGSACRFSAALPAGRYYINQRYTDATKVAEIPNIETVIPIKRYQPSMNGNTNEVFYTSFEKEGAAQLPEVLDYYKTSLAKEGEWVCQSNCRIDLSGFKPGLYRLSYWKYNTVAAQPQWIETNEYLTISANLSGYILPANSKLYIDEIRIVPEHATMSTCTYKPGIGKTSETDIAGHTIYYNYDDAGRLISVKDTEGQLIKRYTYTGYNKITEESINGNADLNRTVTYLDGMGRKEQVLEVGASPNSKDIVQFWDYDNMGRADATSYLPYELSAPGSGSKRVNPYSEQVSFYNTLLGTSTTHAAFAYKFYDTSPQGVVTKTRRPKMNAGKMNDLYETNYRYGFNTAANNVRHYIIENDSVVKWAGYYPADKLTVKESKTPTTSATVLHCACEYYDADNRLVMSETVGSPTLERTYYVYDSFGRTRYAIPSAGNDYFKNIGDKGTPFQLHTYCHYTVYDKYGNSQKQLVAGTDWEYILYDKRGRMVLSQKGEMRKSDPTQNQWLFTKYDELNRVAMTGVYTGGTYAEHKAALENQTIFAETRNGSMHEYTNQAYPVIQSVNDVLTVTYYDNYSWQRDERHQFYTYGYQRRINIDGEVVKRAERISFRPQIKGQVTGRKVKVLGEDVEDTWLTTTNFYDTQGRVTQTISDLYPLSGNRYERVINHLNAVGDVTYAYVAHLGGGVYPVGYGKEFAYDHRDRLTKITQLMFLDRGLKYTIPPGYMNGYDFENDKVDIARYTYDALGRMKTKAIHNGAETTTYTYGISGEVLSATSPSFSYTLGYDNTSVGGSTPRYDGKPNYATWQQSGGVVEKGYRYDYDALGQMTAGRYLEKQAGVWNLQTNYCENMTYGPSGIITKIERSDATGAVNVIDQTYSGYQMTRSQGSLLRPTNATYVYNKNGDLSLDGSQRTTINYNIIGLPSKIYTSSRYISYIYSADGEKLATAVKGSYTCYYRNSMLYEAGESFPTKILTQEGFVEYGSQGFTYKYHKTDHAGNVRAVVNQNMVVEQATDYYPFGLAHSYNNLNRNRFLFSGKELQDANVGMNNFLGVYDFGARLYNPTFGHWFNVNPALQMANPYLFCGNAPMCYIDQDGEWFWIIPLVIAGAINVGSNWDNIDNVWQGLTYFGVGAASGAASMFGSPFAGSALLGAANSIVTQGNQNGWGNINYGTALGNAAVSFALSTAGSAMGTPISSLTGKITSGISSPVLREGLNSGLASGLTGATVGFGASMATGGDFEDALKSAGNGGLMGLGAGFVSGTGHGYSDAKATGLNPWTGKPRAGNNFGERPINNRQYDPKVDRRAEQDSPAHDFPYSFDEQVLATDPIVKSDGYRIYRLDGAMNGKSGYYEIGKYPDAAIDHRFFRPMKY